jgi:DNA helicase-2/ATP-dependent DNA helicase PcrA
MQRGFGWNNEAANAEKRYGPPPSKTSKSKSQPEYLPVQPPSTKVVEHTPSTDFTPSDTSNLQAGQEVEHQKFGFGTVSKVEGSAHNPVATIQFKLNGEKKIMLNYARLRIVS